MSDDLGYIDAIGSTTRDVYRKLHKERENYSSDEAWRRAQGLDIDFWERRTGGLVAVTDIKAYGSGDGLTWTEEQAYREIRTKMMNPIFVIWIIDDKFQHFRVESWPNKIYSAEFKARRDFFQGFVERIEEIADWTRQRGD